MAQSDFPGTLNEITPEWLSDMMQRRELLRTTRVRAIDRQVLGEGQGFVGDVVRLVLDLDRDEPGAPRSLIAKLPTTTSRKNRGFSQMSGTYEREIRFYREFSNRVGARVPQHFYSAFDPTPGAENGEAVARFFDAHLPHWLQRLLVVFFAWLSAFNLRRYILVLEDASPAEVGDQVAGCTLDDARLALQTLAEIHASFWNDAELETTWWISSANAVVRSTQQYYVRALPSWLERHAEVVTPKTRRQLEWLVDHGESLLRRLGGPPFCLLHGDYRLDNLFIDRARGELIVADWQTPLRGLPAMDIAHFLSGSLRIEVPDADEEALLDTYHESLEARGIEDYARDALGRDYRLCLLVILQRMVLSESDLFEIGGVRGDALLASWLERTARRLERVEADQLLPALTRMPVVNHGQTSNS